jgi:hypothetical protein
VIEKATTLVSKEKTDEFKS